LVGRVLALVLRPLFIFFDVTLLGYVLLRVAGDSGMPGYLEWLRELFPLQDPIADGIEISLQLAVAATAVAVVLGGLLGLAMRSSERGRSLIGWSIPILSVAGPTLMLALVYWLAFRLDAFPAAGAARFTDDPAEALRRLVLPALAIGVPMAPALATIAARNGLYGEPYGMAAAGSLLASRAESRDGWRFGFPASLLVVGLLLAEIGFARPGVVRLAVDGLLRLDYAVALDALAVVALGGAALALVIDLIGLRPYYPTTPTTSALRLAEHSAKPPPRLLLSLAGGLLLVLVAITGWGAALDPNADLDITGALAGPFSDGHVLGTDDVGRDLLTLAIAGAGEPLTFALVSTLIALGVGLVLALLQRSLGVIGEIVPGAVVDGLWWPLPLLAIFAGWAFDNAQLAHPAVVAVFAAGLVPTALRLIRRDPLSFDGGGWLRLAGLWFLLAPVAFLAHLAASFPGFTDPERPSLGAQMGNGLQTLAISAWPAAVPSILAALILLALFGLGSSLVQFASSRSTRVLTSELDVERHDVPIRQVGQPILAGEPVRFVPDLTVEPDWDDHSPLTPNYHLQPGLPQLDPYDESVSLDDVTMIPPPPTSQDELA